ncbi:efflux RND transporter periplasmic adaptor subunit [Rugamonas sp.]|uniref:efflux RND transporter periplasmic adaptor subunit n=1 Tax=Rugamonas sp. TaxID=1926287 RepID=UPI0025EE78F3|nr:efflux RND transporter periplasmic adaptor subunit [Rugamonas sp.]
MIKRRYAIGAPLAVAVLVAALVGVRHAAGRAEPQAESPAAKVASANADADEGDAAASALVLTQAVARQEMALTAGAYGEVDAGLPESLSFAQAGRLTRIVARPGQAVHRAEVLATLEPDPAAQAAYAQAANAVAFAQRELRRNQDLLALQLATQSQVDAATHQLQDAQAALTAQAKLGGARDALQMLAPFDAVVVSIAATQGERLAAGAAVLQLGRRDTPRVLLQIEPSLPPQLHVGAAVRLTPLQGDAPPFAAAIAQVQDAVDPKTQMIGAVVALSPASATAAHLLPGMRVSAVVELGRVRAWSVPRQAVLSDERGSYLFQVAQGKARRVDVRTLVETSAAYGVDGALNAALPLVVQGNYELTDGMAVRGAAK